MLSVDGVNEIHFELAKIFAEENDPISPCGVKDINMLESACARPDAGLGRVEKYNSLELKVAALFHSLTKNHPFHNGNKRTAVAAMLSVLYKNNRRLSNQVSDDDIYDFAVNVTADSFPNENHGLSSDEVVSTIAAWIKENSQPINTSPGQMSPAEFSSRCSEAGAVTKSSGAFHQINHNGKSIKIRKTKKKIPSMVLKSYLKALQLNEGFSGVVYDEFVKGANNEERAQIYRFMAALRRLART